MLKRLRSTPSTLVFFRNLCLRLNETAASFTRRLTTATAHIRKSQLPSLSRVHTAYRELKSC